MIGIPINTSDDTPSDPDSVGPEARQAGPDDPAWMAVRSALAGGLHWLLLNEPGAREGDPAGVHHLRTTTRRLRTALSLFGGLLDPARVDGLDADLKWLAGLLGAVRDLDVLVARFRSAAEGGGWGETLEPLFAGLEERHAAASEALRDALRGDRYEGLKARLAVSLGDETPVGSASEPCRTALPALVFRVWKPLRRAGRSLAPDDPDDDFHEVRKRAKRARYAAEAVVDALAPRPAAAARRFARRARDVQDILGAHQDAVISASEVRRAAGSHPDLGPFNLTAGRLLEREERAAAETRDAFFPAWAELDRKKVARWLKP